jgi:hypothetical protein
VKIVDPGSIYELSAGNGLVFLRKDGGTTVRDGTTIEEVLEVLIDRVTEGYQRLPCQESIRALYLLREALATFQARSHRRMDANVEGTLRPHDPVTEPADVLRYGTMGRAVEVLDQAPN